MTPMVGRKLRDLVRPILSFRIPRYEHITGLLLLGILLRIALSIYTSHPNDTEVWYVTAINMLSGQGSPYGTWYFSYPPVWAYIYLPFVSISSFFSNPYLFYTRLIVNGNVVAVLSPLFNLMVKLPIIIGDILVGLIIYEFIRDLKDEHSARMAFIFWFFNPFVIIVGAMDAQFDVLPALLSLLAFLFFIKRKYFLGSVSLGIGIMAKVYPVYFVPFYVVFLFRENLKIKWKKGILSSGLLIASILLVVALLLVPVIASNSFRYFYEGIFRRGDYITSLGGITPLSLLYLFPGAFEWVSYYGRAQIIMLTLYALQAVGLMLISFFFIFRSEPDHRLRNFLRGHVCLLALIYLTILTVNPQYIIWTMPFLIIGFALFGNYKSRLIILSVSASFLDFYFGYPFYPFIPYVNKEIGLMLNNVLNLSTTPVGYLLRVFFSFAGAVTILFLWWPAPKIPKLKGLLSTSKKEENGVK